MAQTVVDSVIYGGLWSRAALREVFEEVPRTRDWLEILAVLAEVQAEHEVIPPEAARALAETCRGLDVDDAFLKEARAGREASGHSTQGLIQAVQRRCPSEAGEWLYYGATVQDLTDTWLMRALQRVRVVIASDLRGIDETLTALAARHRDTPMAGRTHGQPGLPVTFGFKVAGWVAEVRRHCVRLDEVGSRMDIGQLAGGVGSLASLGPRALQIQSRFCARLGLRAPVGSWTVSRDVIVEWCNLLALVCGIADRVGQEVYNLQRAEIGELSEGFTSGTVGSITMPHKRNPEIAEHLGTLARTVRHLAASVLESLVHDHERDGRAWKAEWHAVPECTVLAARALELFAEMVAQLQVHPDRMRDNLERTGGFVLSEAVMLALAPHVGRASAHRLVYEIASQAHEQGQRFTDAVRASPAIATHLPAAELDAIFEYRGAVGQCGALVDRIVERADAP